MDVGFILFNLKHSRLIHLLVFQLDRKGGNINEKYKNQPYCLIKVGKYNYFKC